MEVAEALHGKMQYFDELDRVAAQFHGASLDVDSDRFLPLLQRLDDCISCALMPTLILTRRLLHVFNGCIALELWTACMLVSNSCCSTARLATGCA